MKRPRGRFAAAALAVVAAAALVTYTGVVDPVSAAPREEAAAAGRDGPSRSPSIYDNLGRMDVNNLDMVVTNHGSIAYDLLTGNAGLIYPKGLGTTAIFATGPWIGALVGGQVRVAMGEYSQEYVPGPMANGTFLPDLPQFRNFRIDRFGQGHAEYLSDAVSQGAPLDAQGNPLVLGDVTIWSVFNDADPAIHTNAAGRTAPLGIEVQQTVFAFNRAGPLGNVIFLKWKLRNRGSNTLHQTFLSLWSDPDLGGPGDDLVGCDTTLALGYVYNATNQDVQYGSDPPAAGFQLLRGPVVPVSPGVFDTLGMTSFTKYINGTDPRSAIESYNTMRGLHADGTVIHVADDPLQPVTTYEVSGVPGTGGWLDSNPSDRRMQVSTGPFTMAPGDEQEIIAAVLVGQGADRLSSISALRVVAAAAHRLGVAFPLAISAPSSRAVDEGAVLAFDVLTSDPEGAPLTLSSSTLPMGATFVDHGNGTGSFQWTPGFDQAGDYTVTFTATRGDGGNVSAVTDITVRNVNRAPLADVGGPYTTFAGVPLTLDARNSADPDGDPLTYGWTFGDDTTGTGATPAHAYAAPGLYNVLVTVSDGATSDDDATTVSVLDAFAARAFAVSGNRTIRLSSGKATWCVEVEPVGRSFPLAAVDLGSVVMKSEGTGSVSSIPAVAGKSAVGADRDGNGVGEITACFSKDNLRLLFSNVQSQASVPITIEGNVITGGSFRAPMTVGVQGGGPSSVATTPSPLRGGRGAFEFATTRAGAMSIRLFDVSGRLVRTVAAERAVGAGVHRVEFETRDERGAALGAGIYFYRVALPEGAAVGRVVILP